MQKRKNKQTKKTENELISNWPEAAGERMRMFRRDPISGKFPRLAGRRIQDRDLWRQCSIRRAIRAASTPPETGGFLLEIGLFARNTSRDNRAGCGSTAEFET